VGIDASPAMVRLAAGPESLVLVGDATRLPLADDAVDLVVAYMCLHDIDDMPRAVAEVSRVLEPSGRLCLAIPHPVSSAGAFTQREPDAPFVISGSYLDPAPRRLVVERGGIRLTFHSEHRPIEAYTRALEEAGLLIQALREVRAPDELVALDPAGRRWQRIPMFLHLRAIKPTGGGCLSGLAFPGDGPHKRDDHVGGQQVDHAFRVGEPVGGLQVQGVEGDLVGVQLGGQGQGQLLAVAQQEVDRAVHAGHLLDLEVPQAGPGDGVGQLVPHATAWTAFLATLH
jgi:hypothetical protein